MVVDSRRSKACIAAAAAATVVTCSRCRAQTTVAQLGLQRAPSNVRIGCGMKASVDAWVVVDELWWWGGGWIDGWVALSTVAICVRGVLGGTSDADDREAANRVRRVVLRRSRHSDNGEAENL